MKKTILLLSILMMVAISYATDIVVVGEVFTETW
jgi:hypothetical protein